MIISRKLEQTMIINDIISDIKSNKKLKDKIKNCSILSKKLILSFLLSFKK